MSAWAVGVWTSNNIGSTRMLETPHAACMRWAAAGEIRWRLTTGAWCTYAKAELILRLTSQGQQNSKKSRSLRQSQTVDASVPSVDAPERPRAHRSTGASCCHCSWCATCRVGSSCVPGDYALPSGGHAHTGSILRAVAGTADVNRGGWTAAGRRPHWRCTGGSRAATHTAACFRSVPKSHLALPVTRRLQPLV